VTIQDLIASKSGSLTPTERRIARVVLEDPTRLAFGTVADLAEKASTSHPTIVRFAIKLGFEGYTALQSWVQDGVSKQLSSPSERVHQRDERSAVRAGVERAVSGVFDALDEPRLDQMAAPIAGAANVWIVSGETSMAGAQTLASGLSMVRPGVTLVQEHTTGRDIAGAAPNDAGVIFDFTRYRRSAITTARALHEAGVDLVAVTDGPLSPLAELTPNWCALTIPAVGPFDSSAPAVVAAELLVSRVARALGEATVERIHNLERVWRATRTFLTDEPAAQTTGALPARPRPQSDEGVEPAREDP